MKKILFTGILFFLHKFCLGQLTFSLDDDSAHIARVEKEAALASTDSIKAYTCLKLSGMYRLLNDTVKIHDYLQKGISLSEKYPFLKAASFYYKAQTLYAKRDIPGIEYNLLKSDSLLSRFTDKEAFKLRGYIRHAYGAVQQMKGIEKDAMNEFLNKALPYAQQSGDFFIIGNVNKAIATVFMNANQRPKASTYLQAAVSNVEKASTDNPLRLETLAELYIYAAENYAHQDILDSAKMNLDKARGIIGHKSKSNLYLSYYYAEGTYFNKLKKYTDAVSSFNKGIALGANVPAAQLSVNRLKYANFKALFNGKEFNAATAVMLDLLKSPLVFTADKKLYYKELSNAYAAAGNKQEAYHWAAKYIPLSDSLYEAKFQNDIVELEKKYNDAENQKKISALHAEKEKGALSSKNDRLLIGLLSAVTLFLLSFSVLGWLYFRNNKKLSAQKELSYRQQLKEVKQEQQLQFTKALLQGEERERKRLAGDLHDGLGGMLAGVKFNLSCLSPDNKEEAFAKDLPVIINQLDKSVNELRRIAHNMMPESLLNAGLEVALKDLCESPVSDSIKIDFQAFNIEKQIMPDIQITIYRIIQELLTNAVRHAGASSILLQCSQNENIFYITVEDNGKGFDTAKEHTGKGIGLLNVKNRVDYLKGSLEINSAPGEGTTINIEFNVNE